MWWGSRLIAIGGFGSGLTLISLFFTEEPGYAGDILLIGPFELANLAANSLYMELFDPCL